MRIEYQYLVPSPWYPTLVPVHCLIRTDAVESPAPHNALLFDRKEKSIMAKFAVALSALLLAGGIDAFAPKSMER